MAKFYDFLVISDPILIINLTGLKPLMWRYFQKFPKKNHEFLSGFWMQINASESFSQSHIQIIERIL